MAKTVDDKKAKLAAKKAAAKARREAKKAALLEKKRKRAEAMKAKKEAKRAKKLALIEKKKARKAALKEKKRLAKEKKLAVKTAKTVKMPATGEVDIKEAAKQMKKALAQIAGQMAQYDSEKRAKKAKSIRWMGYAVETVDGGNSIVVKFDVEKSKKATTVEAAPKNEKKEKKERKPRAKAAEKAVDEVKAVASAEVSEPEAEKAIEVPAGDLFGTDGQVAAEVANLDPDDEGAEPSDEDEDDIDDDGTIADPRDETDEDLVDARREFFANGEGNGEYDD